MRGNGSKLRVRGNSEGSGSSKEGRWRVRGRKEGGKGEGSEVRGGPRGDIGTFGNEMIAHPHEY